MTDNILSKILRALSLVLLIGTGLASCTDELLVGAGDEIPYGETEFVATVDYKAFTDIRLDSSTRASGDFTDGQAVKKIETLWVVIYEQDGAGGWRLHGDSPVRITEYDHDLVTEVVDNTRPDGLGQAEEQTGRATFRMQLKNGLYRMYAVANHDLSSIDPQDLDTPAKLRALPLDWDTADMGSNSEMFGPITATEDLVTEDQTIRIVPGVKPHAWIRRAVSKVTVAYDTTDLFEGIDIYLKSVTLHDIPQECYLGLDNTPGAEGRTISNALIADGPSLYYGNGAVSADWKQWRPISKATGIWGSRSEHNADSAPVGGDLSDRKAWEHAEITDALYLYENKQGKGKDKAQTAHGPGNNDGWYDTIGFPEPVEGDEASGWKDGKAYGSYIEVEAYYVCRRKGHEQQGPIRYRFMLGRDISEDYNTDRNCHFKLTLKFNGMANDADWHVDYLEPVLTVTDPRIFDYRGMVFLDDHSIYNWGNTFSADNTVIVNSYSGTPSKELFNDFKIEYRETGETEWKESASWLSATIEPGSTAVERRVQFHADTTYREILINTLIGKQPEKGKSARYNLAHPDGTANSIMETANSYIVDAQGQYILPLIYGNGYYNGAPNTKSYTYFGAGTGESYLKTFRNHLGNNISSPEIRKNSGCENPKDAVLVWQDSKNLVTNVAYDPSAYGGKGGIRFDVTSPVEGNAVLAIRDAQGRIMWSWQIWVTCMDYGYPYRDQKDAQGNLLYEFDETIPVTAFRYGGINEMMYANLGWNSEGHPIRIYPKRQCEVRISSGQKSYTMTIHQESHIAFAQGSNTYYQWGRKDPFIGSLENSRNKPRYTPSGDYGERDNPKRMYDDWSEGNLNPGQYTGVDRQTTRNALHLYILHPDVWFNPPRRKATTEEGNLGLGDVYICTNKNYNNLWCNTESYNTGARSKTVYDPCPPGYMVPNHLAFTGFTDNGSNITISQPAHYDFLWDARLENIAPGCPTDGVYEFYTDSRKVQSICFPISGYRDWDALANVYWFGTTGYVWSNEKPTKEEVADDDQITDADAFNFMFSREKELVYPSNAFFASDGFPVRPVKY